MRRYFLILIGATIGLDAFCQLTFSETALTGLPTDSMTYYSEWEDMDGDGDLDAFIHGSDGTTSLNGIYENEGGNSFSLHTSLPAWTDANAGWQDYDLDGDMDLMISATTGGQSELLIYIQQAGTFNGFPTGLPSIARMKVQWGNVNNDLYPDLVTFGVDESNNPNDPIINVFGNLGNGTFEPIAFAEGIRLTGNYPEELDLILADFNNDDLTDFVYQSRVDIQYYWQQSPNTFEWGRDVRRFGNFAGPFTSAIYNSTRGHTFFHKEGSGQVEIQMEITMPESIAGTYVGIESDQGSTFIDNPISGELVFVDDGSDEPTLGCETLQNAEALNGKIAVIDRGCNSLVAPGLQVEEAGAIAIVYVSGSESIGTIRGALQGLSIPTVLVPNSVGELIRTNQGVNANLTNSSTGIVKSGFYNEIEGLVNEVIALSDGDYFFQLSDIVGNGFKDPGYARMTDAEGRVLFEVGAYSYFSNQRRTPFCIGNDASCYTSPLSLEIQLDEDPDHTRWIVFPANNTTTSYVNDQETLNEDQPFDGTIFAWGDVDQDGSPDALVKNFDGTWNWVQNNTESWDVSGAAYDEGNLTTLVVTPGDERVGAIFSKNNGASNEWVMVKPSNAQTLYDATVPSNLSLDVSGVDVSLTWDEVDDYSSYEIYVEKDNVSVNAPATDGFQGYWSHDNSLKLKLLESGDYDIQVRSVAANGRRSSFSTPVSTSITAPENFEQFTKVYNPIEDADGNSGLLDIDGDGDLDAFLDGVTCFNCFEDDNERDFRLYRNENGVFNSVQVDELFFEGRQSFWPVPISWVDIDNDGDLDFVAGGRDPFGDVKTYLYVNENWSFEQKEVNLPAFEIGSYVWGDYDNDGDLDVFATGSQAGFLDESSLYQNYGGDFAKILIDFQELYFESAEWVDYDNDGDLDLSRNGTSTSGDPITELYKNQDGSLKKISTNLPKLHLGDLKWGDIDQDGDKDLVITGTAEPTEAYYLVEDGSYVVFDFETHLFINEGSNTFSEGSIDLEGLYFPTFDFGDVDNDGDLDLVVLGGLIDPDFDPDFPFDPPIIHSGFLLENDNGSFITTNQLFDGVNGGNTSLGDIDGDADLDLFYNGSFQPEFTVGDAQYSRVYLNNSKTVNTAPCSPSNLQVDISGNPVLPGNPVVISWESGTDAETQSDGLTYHVTLYKEGSLVSQLYQPGTLGEIGSINQKEIKNLTPGNYRAEVITVDNGMAISAEASVEFSVAQPFEKIKGVELVIEQALWFDTDNDGVMELAGMPEDYRGGNVRLATYERMGNEFIEVNSFEFGEGNFKILNGDFDLNGFQDLSISGTVFIDFDNFEIEQRTTFFENYDGSFEATNERRFDLGSDFSVAPGDFDNDGDLDIVVTNPSPTATHIMENTGSGFVERQLIEEGNFSNVLDWIDYDNDDDLDLLICGLEDNIPYSKIYENVDGVFSYDSTALSIVDEIRNWSFMDIDSDGDLDILFSQNQTNRRLSVFVNNEGKFEEGQVLINQISRFSFFVMNWADFDNDGDSDLALSYSLDGFIGGDAQTTIYRNDNGFLIDTEFLTDSLASGSVQWLDLDQDLDLDLFISGRDPFESRTSLMINEQASKNDHPSAPTNLSSLYDNGYMYFNWDEGSDAQSTADQLTYNVRIWDDNGMYVRPPVLNDGTLLTLEAGNAGITPSFKFNGSGLPDGEYQWAVQTVDNGYLGSEFTEPQTVLMCYEFFSDTLNFNVLNRRVVGSPLSFVFDEPRNLVDIVIDFGDGSTSKELDARHIYTEAGAYEVTLTLTSALGCVSVTTLSLDIEEAEAIPRITNVVTPNGDGFNDYLVITDARLDLENRLVIYNAYGQKIFETENYLNDWSATRNGKTLPNGTYLAVFELVGLDIKVSQVFNVLRE